MAKYKITALADTPTSTGKSKKTVSLVDESNAIYEKVGIWSDFPNYANLMVGQMIDGDLKTSPDGKWRNLVPPATGTTRGGAYTKPQAITKAIEQKQEGIKVAQENKELGIKISSTVRMAVDIVNTIITNNSSIEMSADEIKRNILGWRKWLWEHWDAKDTDFAPFPDRPDMRVREQDRNIKLEDITFDQPDPREDEFNAM